MEDGLNPILDDLNCSATLVALRADGASFMSGCNEGVTTKIRTTHPWVIYIHCAAHRLNLIVVTYLSTVSDAKNVIESYRSIHKVFNVAKNRERFEEFQRKFYPTEQVKAASSLIEVRWSCKFD